MRLMMFCTAMLQTFGYRINSLLGVCNSTSRISSAWIVLTKMMLKPKNASGGECHLLAIILILRYFKHLAGTSE